MGTHGPRAKWGGHCFCYVQDSHNILNLIYFLLNLFLILHEYFCVVFSGDEWFIFILSYLIAHTFSFTKLCSKSGRRDEETPLICTCKWLHSTHPTPLDYLTISSSFKISSVRFTCREYRTNDDLEINIEPGIMRYTPKYRTELIIEESVGNPEDIFLVLPNIALLVSRSLAYDEDHNPLDEDQYRVRRHTLLHAQFYS